MESSTRARPLRALREVPGVRAAVRADREAFRWTAARPDSPVDRPLRALTHAGDHSVLWWVVCAGLVVAGGERGRWAAARGALSIGLASLTVNQPLKRTLRRPRPPYDTVPVPRRARALPTTTSFPSGHAASAGAFATAVSQEVPAIAAPLWVVAAGVGWSRVHTGVHYPGDVLVGMALGAGAGWLSRPLARRLAPALRLDRTLGVVPR